MLSSAPETPGRSSPVTPWPVMRLQDGAIDQDQDLLATEEPLEIRITHLQRGRRRQRVLSVTMRTPGSDRELAAGFLFTEGIVHNSRDILAIYACRQGNMVRVHLRDTVQLNPRKLQRHFYTSSSCGVCGKTSLEAVQVCINHAPPTAVPQVSAAVIQQLPQRLRESQAVFACTGGLHASALFDEQGELVCLREDVGRHNALDKVIGHALLRKQVPLSRSILLVSGRASFELVQKAAVAGIPVLAAVGAPSSLAVQLADRQKLTLLGFVRHNRFNIYSGAERIVL